MNIAIIFDDLVGGERRVNEELVRSLRHEYPTDTWRVCRLSPKNFSGMFAGTRYSIAYVRDLLRWLEPYLGTLDVVIAASSQSRLVLPWIKRRSSKIRCVHLFHSDIVQRHRCLTEQFKDQRALLFLLAIPRYLYSYAFNILMKKFHQYALTFADKIFTFSTSASRILKTSHGVPERKIRVIPMGLNHQVFNSTPVDSKSKQSLFQKFGVSNASPLVMYVGRIDPLKRIEHLVVACEEVSHQFPFTLLVVHPVVSPQLLWYYNRLKSLSQSRKKKLSVVFIQSPSDRALACLYRLVRCVVLPSSREIDPCVMYESLASETMFLGTRVGSVPSILSTIDRRLLIDKGSPRSIARSLTWVLSLSADKRKRLTRRGVEVVRSHSWTRTADALYQLISSL